MKKLTLLTGLLFLCTLSFAQKTIFTNDTIDIIDVIDVENFVIVPSVTACEGQLVTLCASGANITDYLWSNGETTSSINIRATLNTSYSVTVTFLSGTSAVVTPNITVLPVPVITITGPSQVVSGLPITINASVGNYDYAWNYNGGYNSSAEFVPTQTTTYTVTATASSGCSAEASHQVVVLPSLNSLVIESIPYSDLSSTTSVVNELKAIQDENDIPNATDNVLDNNSALLSISPNPSSEQVELNLNLPSVQNVNINLYNLTGQLVESRQLGQVQTIREMFNIVNLPAGIYLVAVQSEGAALALKKLIKQ